MLSVVRVLNPNSFLFESSANPQLEISKLPGSSEVVISANPLNLVAAASSGCFRLSEPQSRECYTVLISGDSPRVALYPDNTGHFTSIKDWGNGDYSCLFYPEPLPGGPPFPSILLRSVSPNDWERWQPLNATAACHIERREDGSFRCKFWFDDYWFAFEAADFFSDWVQLSSLPNEVSWPESTVKEAGEPRQAMSDHGESEYRIITAEDGRYPQLFRATAQLGRQDLWQPHGTEVARDFYRHLDGSFTCIFWQETRWCLFRALDKSSKWERFFAEVGGRACKWLFTSQDDNSFILCLDEDVYLGRRQKVGSSSQINWTSFGSKIYSPDSSVESYLISEGLPDSSSWVLLKIGDNFYQIAEDGVDILAVTLSNDGLTASVLGRKDGELIVSRFDCQ